VHIPDLLADLDLSWSDRPKNWIKLAPSAAIVPAPVGWFLRSTRSHLDSDDFQYVLQNLAQCPSLGLEQKMVKDGSPYQAGVRSKNPYATHIECDLSARNRLISFLKTTYSPKASTTCPLGISLQFIEDISLRSVKGSGLAMQRIKKCIAFQTSHTKLIQSTPVSSILDIDAMIPSQESTLRQWLMSMVSTSTQGRSGDRLFHSIDRRDQPDSASTYTFTYYQPVATEATAVAEAIPLVLQHELHVDPYQYCSYDEVEYFTSWTWDANNRLAESDTARDLEAIEGACTDLQSGLPTHPTETGLDALAQAQYDRANGKEDASLVSLNGIPLPVVVGNGSAAPANIRASDDASVLSNLTSGTTESKRVAAAKAARAQADAFYAPQLHAQASANALLKAQLADLTAKVNAQLSTNHASDQNQKESDADSEGVVTI
jgi:hypothetical protein